MRFTWTVLIMLSVGLPIRAAEPPNLAQIGVPFVAKYCVSCHGEKKPKADISLHTLTCDLSKPKELQVWQAVLAQIDSRDMPPKASKQPTDNERTQLLQSLTAAIKASGVVLDDNKWLSPVKGNYVDHQLLFSGVPAKEITGTKARLWRITGPAYEDYIDKLIKRFILGLRNYGEFRLTAPWNFTPQKDFPDYASAHRVGEAEIEYLLRNAAIVSQAMIKRHSGNVPSYGGYIKELATLIKAGMKATPEQADAVLTPTFRELFGREPSDREKERYGTFLRNTTASLGGAEAAEQLLIALLCQTEMIYRIEVPNKLGTPQKLDARSLSRSLAFALTDQLPDQLLQEAVAQGKFGTREEVAIQVRRILDDAKVEKPRVLRFFREYFGYDSAPNVFKDEVTLQKIGVRGARGWNADFYVSDADQLVLSVLAQDRDVLRELLTTTKTFAMTNPPQDRRGTKSDEYRLKKPNFEQDEQTLIKVYELPIKARADWDPKKTYDFPEGHRLGLLTHPAWLVAQSGNFDNHAIHRGRWIRERLLGGRIPELPITVNAMLPDEPHHTLRDRIKVTREEYCWTCHKQMDPLGLPFEQFDHFGQFRKEEMVVDREATADKKNLNKNGLPRQTIHKLVPLDTTGEVSGSIDPKLDGPVKDPFELIRRLAHSEHVEQVFVRHAFRYFLGRNETMADGPTLIAAHQAYRKNGGSMKALITALLTSDALLYRTNQ
ncbi:MAG: DUF1588 domain-containing protein [Planctomycetes bacterium]|nr:DUF1588 domain-containing protein [Planctomycetota bacterium]